MSSNSATLCKTFLTGGSTLGENGDQGGFWQGPEQLNQPEDIAVDNKGLIYVTDTRNSRVQILEVKN